MDTKKLKTIFVVSDKSYLVDRVVKLDTIKNKETLL